VKIKLKYILLFTLTAFVVGLDQWTKSRVVAHFQLGETLSLISGIFNLTYIRNTGAAFGILAQANPVFRIPFFVIVPLVALVTIAYIFRKIPDRDVKLSTALSLVIGGAVGNLVDRIQLGYVVDFLDFHWNYQYHFPAFNVADSAICVGVGILMIDLFINSNAREAAQRESNVPSTR
jgi:signal peptidase II